MADNKEEYESLWESFVNLGVMKAMGLVWGLYILVYIVTMSILYLIVKHR